jgi:hypothetical protein
VQPLEQLQSPWNCDVVKTPHYPRLTTEINKYTIDTWLGSFAVDKTILFKESKQWLTTELNNYTLEAS